MSEFFYFLKPFLYTLTVLFFFLAILTETINHIPFVTLCQNRLKSKCFSCCFFIFFFTVLTYFYTTILIFVDFNLYILFYSFNLFYTYLFHLIFPVVCVKNLNHLCAWLLSIWLCVLISVRYIFYL